LVLATECGAFSDSRELPVTTLAALRVNDESILLAADSFGVRPSEGYPSEYEWYEVTKIESDPIPNGRLAWGIAGEDVAEIFGNWLRNTANTESWVTLIPEVRKWVTKTNHPPGKPPLLDQVKVLLTGFLNGEQKIIGFRTWGEPYCPPGDSECLFVGVGESSSAHRWGEMCIAGMDQSGVLLRTQILDPLVIRLSGVRGPVRWWRITPSDFQEIDAPAG